jgi:hypothetical protein
MVAHPVIDREEDLVRRNVVVIGIRTLMVVAAFAGSYGASLGNQNNVNSAPPHSRTRPISLNTVVGHINIHQICYKKHTTTLREFKKNYQDADNFSRDCTLGRRLSVTVGTSAMLDSVPRATKVRHRSESARYSTPEHGRPTSLRHLTIRSKVMYWKSMQTRTV